MQICLAWRSICTLRVGGNLWDIITHFSKILLSLGSTGFYVTICSFTRVSFVCFSLYNHSRTTPLPCLPQATPKWIKVWKTYKTLSEAVIRSMEPLNVCFPRGALTPPHIPTVPGSTGLTDSSPSTTPAVNRVFPVSLSDAFKQPFTIAIPIIQPQVRKEEKQRESSLCFQ